MFLEKSDRDGLHGLLSLPRTVWSSTEQQFAVKGLHGFELLLLFLMVDEEEEEELIVIVVQ